MTMAVALFTYLCSKSTGQVQFTLKHGPDRIIISNRRVSWASKHGNLGPIYTRSQGQGSTQIKQCYWCKSWNEPQGLYTRSQGLNRKNLFNLPQVTNKFWTLWNIGPKAKKGYRPIWEANLQPLGPMFQHLSITWRQMF
jgi:hypothetical protein